MESGEQTFVKKFYFTCVKPIVLKVGVYLFGTEVPSLKNYFLFTED